MDYKSIFTAPYTRRSWQELLHDIFLSKVIFAEQPWQVQVDASLADAAYQLGVITLSDIHRLAVYEVALTTKVDIAHNRRGIRDLFTADWRQKGYAGAFVIAYRAQESSLRFSYVSETYGFNDRGEYAKIATATKRYTYLLGASQACRTAEQQFERLKNSNKTLADITAAFSVEALSQEFFSKYEAFYKQFVEHMMTTEQIRAAFVGNIEELSAEEQEAAAKPVRDYVKHLLGRIVFLHFLQKKGWLGVPEGEEWGEGDRDFLRHLFTCASGVQQDNFLDEVLEPLFHGALDTDRRATGDLFDTGVEEIGTVRIPYLNGGLFERDAYDKLPCAFPSTFFGDLLATLAEYNFTIDENDPDDAEVGIDPEMLGRIFESLLEDNKDKGAYYTPKEIVQYMCRESLIAYLEGQLPTAEEGTLRQFVADLNTAGIANYRDAVDTLLRAVKICDPAIGSGAFPMGLLKELYRCRTALADAAANPAAIKRDIIQQNIYGVDIERGAVEIARLRFWLALVVDEESPATLPNLDFKIMQGNSLLEQYHGYPLSEIGSIHNRKEEERSFAYDDETCTISIIKEFVDDYFTCDDHDERQRLRTKINKAVKELIAYNTQIGENDVPDVHATAAFFLWHTWFADVFNKGGFDIVIANPPYGAKYSDADKAVFKKQYVTAQTIKDQQKGSLDTFTLFIERGYKLLRKDGVLAYIVPMSITSSDSVTGVHRLLMKHCATIRLSSYAVRPKPVFENAMVNVSIIQCVKTLTPCQHIYTSKMHRRDDNFNLKQLIDNLRFVDVKGLTLYGRIPKIDSQIEKDILTKLFTHKRLKEYIKCGGKPIYYRFAGGRYFNIITNYSTGSSAERTICFDTQVIANSIGCILSSSLSHWFYQIYSDNHNWKDYEIKNFTIPPLTDENIDFLNALYARYLADIEAKANVRTASGTSTYNVATFKEYKIVRSKAIIDEIDDYICPLYGLSPEETDFIKNYELSFRLRGE